MSVCTSCGRQNPADAQFCSGCGDYLRWQDVSAPAGGAGPAPVEEPGTRATVPDQAPILPESPTRPTDRADAHGGDHADAHGGDHENVRGGRLGDEHGGERGGGHRDEHDHEHGDGRGDVRGGGLGDVRGGGHRDGHEHGDQYGDGLGDGHGGGHRDEHEGEHGDEHGDAGTRPQARSRAAEPDHGPPQADSAGVLAAAARALSRGERLAHRHERPDLGAHLATARDRLTHQRLGVAVVGEFKRGKSTLLNALLQTDVCPVDADIVTAVPTVVQYGTEPLARAHFSVGDLTAPGDADRPGEADRHGDADRYGNADRHGNDGRFGNEDGRGNGTANAAIGEGATGEVESEDVDVDRLFEFVSESAATSRRRRLQSVEVWLPHRLLRTGLCLVDTPGVGGLESAHGVVTLSALSNACGMIFVTDASQELTAPELDFLRQALERTPAAICVVTKTDLYPQWRRIAELNRGHLAAAGIGIPLVAVSSFLRLRAWRAPELNEESGFAALFDWLRTEVVEAAAGEAVSAAARDLDFAREQLTEEVTAQEKVLDARQDTQETVEELHRRTERTRRLVDSGAWQQSLYDGVEDLVADVRHDLEDRLRVVYRDVEEVIDQGDPKETWPAVDVWLHRQVVAAATANHDLLQSRAQDLAADVARTFALESDAPLTLGLTAPGELLRGVTLAPAQPSPGGTQGMVRMAFAGRTAVLVPSLVFGVLGGHVGLLVTLGPLALLLGAGIGRKMIKDERERQLLYRRQQAKQACRRYVDDARFVFGHDCLESLRRTRRELRDEFQARAAMLHESSRRALDSAMRTASLQPAERERHGAELARRKREIDRIAGGTEAA